MKRFTAILLPFLFVFIFFIPCNATEITEETTEHPETTEYPDDISREPDLVCESAIVMDAATGRILYQKNADAKQYPASITKIMTVLIALEHNVNFDDMMTMSENAIWGIERDSTHIGLDVGEKITVKDCLYAIMLNSANECAYALAEYVSDDLPSFAKLMNDKAKEVGCENTNFVTPNGLHDDKHYTTAHDMALITRAALQNENFREIAGTLSYTIPSTNLTEDTRPLWNGNKMINPSVSFYYEYCEGGKTGYTTKANNTLVTFSKKDNLELICVILNCDGLVYSYTDSKALYHYCYNNYTYYYPLSDFSFEMEKKQDTEVNAILNNYYTSLDHDMVDLSVDTDYSLLINKHTDTSTIEQEIRLYDQAQDNILGEIIFSYEGEQIGSTPIISTTPLLSSTITQPEEKKDNSIVKTMIKIIKIILIVICSLASILAIYHLFTIITKVIKQNRERRRRYGKRKRRKRDDDYFF